MILSDNEKQLNSAIQGLNNAVKSVIKQYKRRRDNKPKLPTLPDQFLKELEYLQDHIQHCLRELSTKMKSLEAGFEYLRTSLWTVVSELLRKSPKINVIRRTLQHFFLQLLRLHDGQVLLVSGECRHPGDIITAKESKFPSRLSSAERDDGYTRLYNSDCTYSGTGWDEIMAEGTGLQQLLIQELKRIIKPSERENVWEVLVDKGAQALEVLLDQIEVQMRELQQGFSDFNKQVSTDLTRLLKPHFSHVTISLTMADKSERFRCSIGNHICQWERRGSDFKITDVAGVLPSNRHSAKCWENVMAILPVKAKSFSGTYNQTKRRRQIIEDSDEDDEKIVAKMKCVTSIKQDHNYTAGLHVRIESTKSEATANSHTSLRDIKQKMGVNGEELAAAREGLEAEEKDSLYSVSGLDHLSPNFSKSKCSDNAAVEDVNNENDQQPNLKKEEGGFRCIKKSSMNQSGHQTAEPGNVVHSEPLQYRKWGDELLPQVINASGETVPKIVYPSIAPEMPLDISAIFFSR